MEGLDVDKSQRGERIEADGTCDPYVGSLQISKLVLAMWYKRATVKGGFFVTGDPERSNQQRLDARGQKMWIAEPRTGPRHYNPTTLGGTSVLACLLVVCLT